MRLWQDGIFCDSNVVHILIINGDEIYGLKSATPDACIIREQDRHFPLINSDNTVDSTPPSGTFCVWFLLYFRRVQKRGFHPALNSEPPLSSGGPRD